MRNAAFDKLRRGKVGNKGMPKREGNRRVHGIRLTVHGKGKLKSEYPHFIIRNFLFDILRFAFKTSSAFKPLGGGDKPPPLHPIVVRLRKFVAIYGVLKT